jgi:hypothetical protein
VTPRPMGLCSAKVYDSKNRRLQGQAPDGAEFGFVDQKRKRIKLKPDQILDLGSIAIDNYKDDRQRWPGYKPPGMDKDFTFWVNADEKYRASFSDLVDESPSLSTGWLSFVPHSKTSGWGSGIQEITKPLPANPPAEPVTIAINDVTVTDVDEDSGTISVSFGKKDNPTKLLNVPLTPPRALPWEFVKRLRGKVVSIRVSASETGISVTSFSSGAKPGP